MRAMPVVEPNVGSEKDKLPGGGVGGPQQEKDSNRELGKLV